MKYMIGFDHANARTKFVILQSGLTKIDFKAYKIAGDCGSLYSARFSTTNNKTTTTTAATRYKAKEKPHFFTSSVMKMSRPRGRRRRSD